MQLSSQHATTLHTLPPFLTADAELERLKEQLGVLVAPEQFFGGNELVLRHLASGATLRFDALGALKGGGHGAVFAS